MIEMRAAGKSIRTIADELDLSKTTVANRLRVLSDEVASAVALAKDQLLERLELNQVAAFETKLTLYQRLRAHIEKRDFSDVPTDRLIKAWCLLGEELKIGTGYIPKPSHLPLELLLGRQSD
jgi:hypothetical protein